MPIRLFARIAPLKELRRLRPSCPVSDSNTHDLLTSGWLFRGCDLGSQRTSRQPHSPSMDRDVNHIYAAPTEYNSRHGVCPPIEPLEDGGSRTWLVVGPVGLHTNVDPSVFSFTAHVRARATLTASEVFAQAAAPLSRKREFNKLSATCESLRLLARTQRCPDDRGREEKVSLNMRMTHPLSSVGWQEILRRASASLTATAKRGSDGCVSIHAISSSAHTHPWVRYAVAIRYRLVARRVVTRFRSATAFEAMESTQFVAVVAAANSSVLASVREAVELQNPTTQAAPSAVGGAPSPRSTRQRVPYRATMPKAMPSARKMGTGLRNALDHPQRPRHSILTLTQDGALHVWSNDIGTASEGVRYFSRTDGVKKRLATPTMKSMRTARDPSQGTETDQREERLGRHVARRCRMMRRS